MEPGGRERGRGTGVALGRFQAARSSVLLRAQHGVPIGDFGGMCVCLRTQCFWLLSGERSGTGSLGLSLRPLSLSPEESEPSGTGGTKAWHGGGLAEWAGNC